MSTVQRVAMEIGNHRSLKKQTILNMQRFKLIRVTTYMSHDIPKYTEHFGIISCTTACMSQVISKYTEYYGIIWCTATCMLPRPGDCGERVGLMTCLRKLFFPAYFRVSPLQKHVMKVVGGFGKKSC